jgi:hypothetical protein
MPRGLGAASRRAFAVVGRAPASAQTVLRPHVVLYEDGRSADTCSTPGQVRSAASATVIVRTAR